MSETQEKARAAQARSEVMRDKLMNATLDVILESGWAKASTPVICRKAGISRGAQTHHFPSKNELLLASIKKTANEYSERILSRSVTESTEKLSFKEYLEILWEGSLDDRFLHCWIEVLVASRTDDELKLSVADLDSKTLHGMRDVVELLREFNGSSERLGDIIELTVYLLRGMVVQRGVHSGGRNRELFELWCESIDRTVDS